MMIIFLGFVLNSLYPMEGVLFYVSFAKFIYYVVVVIWLTFLGWKHSTEKSG